MRELSEVSAEQVKGIEKLQQDIATVEANKADAEEARAALEDIPAEPREQKALLDNEKGQRKVLAHPLSDKLAPHRT